MCKRGEHRLPNARSFEFWSLYTLWHSWPFPVDGDDENQFVSHHHFQNISGHAKGGIQWHTKAHGEITSSASPSVYCRAIEMPLAYSSIRLSDGNKRSSRGLDASQFVRCWAATSVQKSAFLLPRTHVALTLPQSWTNAFMPILLMLKQDQVCASFSVSHQWLIHGPRAHAKPNMLAILHALVERGTDVFSTGRLRFEPATFAGPWPVPSDMCPLGESPRTWEVGGCLMRW